MLRRLAFVLLLSGCGSSSEESTTPAVATFVGPLTSTDARVGLVVDDTKGVLYVCGGDTTRTTLSRWFKGPRTAAGIDWTNGDLHVVAAPQGTSWSGTLKKSDGTTFSFAVTPVVANTIAGLYDASLPEGRAGVVVFQSSVSESPTILGTFQATSGPFEQVLPVREVSRTAAGIEVKIASKSFFVQPVTP